jgi:hypothetical protein
MRGCRTRMWPSTWRGGGRGSGLPGPLRRAAARLIALADDPTVLDSFPPHGWAVPTLALLAESCTRLHRAGIRQAELAPLVAQLRTLLARHPNEIALAGWPTVLIGSVARFRAALALIDGAPAEARGLLDTANRLAGDSPPHRARIWLDQALALK